MLIEDRKPIETSELTIYSFVKIGTEMVESFSIMKTNLSTYSNYYLEISKEGVNGTETYRYGPGQDYALKDTGSAYIAEFDKITAKEMGVTYHARMYAEKDGVQYCGPELTGTMKQYLANLLTSTASGITAVTKTLVADMLNYGAAAQVFLEYDQQHLVNVELTAEELAALDQYETKGETTAEKTNSNYIPDGENNVLFTFVTLKNRVELSLNINLANLPEAASATEISIQVKTHPEGDEEPQLVTVLPTTLNTAGTMRQATFINTGANTMRNAYDFVVLVDGVEKGNIRTWSVEGYLNEMRTGSGYSDAAKALMNAIVIYGDSAQAYLDAQAN